MNIITDRGMQFYQLYLISMIQYAVRMDNTYSIPCMERVGLPAIFRVGQGTYHSTLVQKGPIFSPNADDAVGECAWPPERLPAWKRDALC